MSYFYAVLWFAIGLILIFSVSRENRIFIFAGVFFLFLGSWWLADALLPEVSLFEGVWGIVLKAVTGAALAVLGASFVKNYRKGVGMARSMSKKEGSEDPERGD